MRIHQRLFFLLLVLLPVQLGKHFWPAWAYVLGRRIDYLSPTIYFTDLLVLGVLGVWVVEEFFKKRQETSRKIPVAQSSLVPCLLFLVAFVNIWVASSKPVALCVWLKVCEYGLLILYMLSTKPAFSWVARGLVIAGIWSSALAVCQFMLHHSVGGGLWLVGERNFSIDSPGVARAVMCWPGRGCWEQLRPYATFPHPNVLAGFLVSIAPIVWLSTRMTSGRMKYAATGLLVLISTALAMTASRFTIGVGFLELVALILFGSGKIRWMVPILLSVLIVMFVALPFSLTPESITDRISQFGQMLPVWEKSPFFGIGLGNWIPVSANLQHLRQTAFLQPIHNIYMLVLVESGLVGLVGFAWFLGRLIWTSITKLRNKKQETRDKRQAYCVEHVACILSLFALLSLGSIDHYPLTLQSGQLLFAIFIGMVMASN